MTKYEIQLQIVELVKQMANTWDSIEIARLHTEIDKLTELLKQGEYSEVL
jgi:hypothetical protein